MGKIISYKIAWNTKSDEGIFLLDTENGIKQVLVDSAAEARIMLTKLRHTGNAYFDREVVHVANEELTFPEPVSHEYKIPEGVEIIAQQVSWVIPEKKKAVTEDTDNSPVKKSTPPIENKKTVVTKKRVTTKKTKDNLQIIEGIGPKIEGLLNAAGITTYLEVKTIKVELIKEILEEGGSRYKMHDPTTWGEQAALASVGKFSELKALQEKLKGGKAKK